MQEYRPDYLIVRYLSNEATPEEQEQLFEWVANNERNHKIFNEYVMLWSQNPKEHSFNVDRALEKLNSRIDAFSEVEKAKKTFSNRWNIAAGISLLIACGYLLFYMGKQAYHQHTLSLLTEFSAKEAVRNLTLPDGSIITLNKNASIQYPESFLGNTREVYLTGEAFFEVQKDSLRPFVIHMGELTTQVLGTSFNIKTDESKTIVAVATGSVLVSDGDQTEILKPYEKITYQQEKFEKEKTDLLNELAWNDHSIIFTDTRLEQAAIQISKRFEVKILFNNEALKKCLITGKFKNQSLDNILHALEYSVGVTHKKEGQTITLYGKGCE